MDHPLARSLMVTNPNILENGTICIPPNSCYCGGWLERRGSSAERKVALALQWATFALAISCLIWYAYQSWKATCGWEEVYVALIEMIKFSIEAFHEFDSPAMLWLSSGNSVAWLRYGEWLLTCPVILIHLSNLTGLKDDYNKRTMGLLVSDIGCIVWGATSAMCTGWIRVIFFLIALAYGMYTYFHAAKVYIESYHTVPKGICRDLVRVLAWVYFCSWGMFPVLFVLGPEGFGHISLHGSAIGHALLDIVSKNLWGLLGNFLRVKIHEHILLYGDIRKKQKINIAGQEMEVETLMAEEDEDTVKQSTAKYASRESFITMRDRLKDRGYEIRASLDGGDTHHGIETGGNGGGAAPALPPHAGGKAAGTEMSKMSMGVGFGSGGGGGAEPGRVILAVPDISMVDFFREQFAQLMVPYEVVPALGIDNTLQLVQQAATLGGCDFVLMHPEFLRDRGPTGLLPRLKMMGQRTAAFGWSSMGPMRDLIEGSGVDAWLEGPSFGSGISQTGLQQLVLRMQQAKRQAAAMGAGGGMMGGGGMGGGGMGMGMGGGGMGGGGMGGGGMGGGGMGGGGMGGGGMGGGGMGGGGMGMGMGMGGGGMGGGGMGGTGAGSMMMGGGVGGGLTSIGSVNNNMMMSAGMGSGLAGVGSGLAGTLQQQMSGGIGGGSMANMSSPQLQMQMQQPLPSPLGGSGASRIGTNPLFGSAPSPLNSQPGQLPPQSPMPLTAMGGGAAANPSEAEMLQQLMTEINRLKNELGE